MGVIILTYLAFQPIVHQMSTSVTRLLWIGSALALHASDVPEGWSEIEIDPQESFESAVSALSVRQYEAALIRMDRFDREAYQDLESFVQIGRNLPVLAYCRDGSVDDAIHLTRLGAFHVFVGELEAGKVIHQLERIRSAALSKAESKAVSGWRKLLIGESQSILRVCHVIELVASKRCTILLTGETGTGKEVVAKAIHAASSRASQPLVSVNCTALPANLVESELFGHAKGAFTGAHTSRLGRFEQAHRGTIFLDEIGDLPLEAQSKLLRVLQEQEFQRVGSSENVRVDVRVIAATNVDLKQAIREKRFREDLYYRLNVVPIRLPPLRERREDIPRLLHFFVEKIRAADCLQPKYISNGALEYLKNRDWPGNVRQLEHAVQMAFALSGERQVLTASDFQVREELPPGDSIEENAAGDFSSGGINFDEVVSRLELSLLDRALKLANGNKARAAELLGIKRTTLLAKMKALSYPAQNSAKQVVLC